jgi:hypothetical protein
LDAVGEEKKSQALPGMGPSSLVTILTEPPRLACLMCTSDVSMIHGSQFKVKETRTNNKGSLKFMVNPNNRKW